MHNGKPKKETPIEFEESSGNVFADLGLDNPEALLATSKLIVKLRIAMEDRNLTDSAAARCLGITRAALTALLRGDFDLFSDTEIRRFTRMVRQLAVKPRKARAAK
jgi:predicted XRE-type DNA-binding protein